MIILSTNVPISFIICMQLAQSLRSFSKVNYEYSIAYHAGREDLVDKVTLNPCII